MKTLYYKIRAVGVTLLLRLLPRNMPVVYSGAGSSLTLCRLAKSLGYSRVLLVTDRFLAESGLLEELTAELAAAQIAYTVFDGVEPDPAFEQVQAGEARLKEAGCEAVIAVGGGSVLDAAKMIAILHQNPGGGKGDLPV
jgi:alcohol dehydrogenase class IV